MQYRKPILFVTHTETTIEKDIYRQTNIFQNIIKSCSGHPKACRSIKNRKSKFYTKPIHSLIYVEDCKNKYMSSMGVKTITKSSCSNLRFQMKIFLVHHNMQTLNIWTICKNNFTFYIDYLYCKI